MRKMSIFDDILLIRASQNSELSAQELSAGESLVQGLSADLPLPANGELPDTIQLFPPGNHKIVAMKDGKAAELNLTIDEAVCKMIRDDFEAIVARAKTGDGAKPFTDFNHEDREASAWVNDIYWAGNDPKTGGIRAKVDWSRSGGEAILGKDFRQFSPNFRLSRDKGEIVGTTPNMGGLVNRPAFRKIEPFFAREGTADGKTQPTKKDPSMNKLHQALVSAGLLSIVPTEETAALADFEAKWAGVNAKLGKLPESEKQVADLTASVSAKDKSIVDIQAKLEKLSEMHSETVVAKAVDDGILAPKDEASKTRWKTMIKADPSNAELLHTFNVAAKAGTPAGDPTKTVVVNANGTNAAAATGAPGDQHSFTVLAKAIQEREKCDANKAMVIAAKENPAVYDAYRQGILYVDPK